MQQFSVTYSIVTPESAEDGDQAESGYLAEDIPLREAIAEFGPLGPVEADICPVTLDRPPRWLTTNEETPNFRTGEVESRSLHFPASLTPSTRIRIARYLGCYGLR